MTEATAERPKTKPRARKAQSTSTSKSTVLTQTTVDADQKHQMVSEAAYYIAEKRGFTNGDPVDDWIEAETQIESLLETE